MHCNQYNTYYGTDIVFYLKCKVKGTKKRKIINPDSSVEIVEPEPKVHKIIGATLIGSLLSHNSLCQISQASLSTKIKLSIVGDGKKV